MEKYAKVISDLASPPLIVTLLLLSMPWRYENVSWPPTLIATVFVALIPWGALIWMRAKGKVSNIHVTDRTQRWTILLLTLISMLAGGTILILTSAPTQVLLELLFLLAGLLIVGAINLVWKLSIHAALMTFAALHSLHHLPGGMHLAVALIVVVGWARIRIQHHTPTQVMAGTLVGVLVSLGDFLPVGT